MQRIWGYIQVVDALFISYQTMLVGPLAPRWLGRSLQASLRHPSSCWPGAGSLAAEQRHAYDSLGWNILNYTYS